jgi:hypothetical protein
MVAGVGSAARRQRGVAKFHTLAHVGSEAVLHPPATHFFLDGELDHEECPSYPKHLDER